MFKVSATLALLVGLGALNTAAAQDVPLECELWGINCPDDGGEAGGGDGGDGGDGGTGGGEEEPTGGDPPADDPPADDPAPAPVEDPCAVVTAKALPSSASAQGVASSEKGLAKASEASAKGVASRECGSSRGRSGRG